jgi:hypothetical protein
MNVKGEIIGLVSMPWCFVQIAISTLISGVGRTIKVKASLRAA